MSADLLQALPARLLEEAPACPDKICEGTGKGILLPLFGEDENGWDIHFRRILYLIGLFWCFMGVAIVSDMFMGAIERITSKTKRSYDHNLGRWFRVKVWNDSVANLSLMALGSSAPEILLSLIELAGNDFYSGDLGPSTIVGSAAFNLLIITAICVVAIPSEDPPKIIKDTSVFSITASCSVFAYFWLLVIVSFISKDVVDIWEALLTFAFFPILVVLAYMADRGYFSAEGYRSSHDHVILMEEASMQEVAAMEMKILQKYGFGLADDELATLMEKEYGARASRAAHRVNAIRGLVGGKRVGPKKKAGNTVEPTTTEMDPSSPSQSKKVAMVGFVSAKYTVLESIGQLQIPVVRTGKATGGVVKVKYKTRGGTATENEDYKSIEGVLEFTEPDQKKTITVEIIDDDATEDNESFFVDLLDVEGDQCTAILAENKTVEIRIVDDDHPGQLTFEKETVSIKQALEEVSVPVVIERHNGAKGEISCKYKTQDDSAVAGKDYIAVEGKLKFTDGQQSATIEIPIKPQGRYENTENFLFILEEPEGFEFYAHTDGGKEKSVCTIFIETDDDRKDKLDRMFSKMKLNWDKANIGHSSWKQQFSSAVYVNGGEEDADDPSIFDWIMHIITLPWKVLFACVPPVEYCDGWACFVCSLLAIGLVTAIIGDLAAMVGCTLGLPDSITAITLVALGTSLPDTFASKQAAAEEEYADASVGNVTGSNSVNVFLGLGMPWTIGAIYWNVKGKDEEWTKKYISSDSTVVTDYPEGAFVVLGGSLGFSVAVFTAVATVCIGVLVLRRCTKSIGGELGGPPGPKYATAAFLVFLWCVYIGLSSWKALDSKGPCE